MSELHSSRGGCHTTLRIIIHTVLDRPGEHDHTARWRGRCTYCGHRVGPNVRQTREQPWRIPAELWGRFWAMWRGSRG